jgi:hypothetical protein
MKIKCDNGLCDRLRFIFSHFYKLNKKEKLVVCWKINKKCNGHFLDLFEPIENLEFTENDSNVDVCGWEPAFNFEVTKSKIYKYLILLPKIKKQIYDLRKKMGKYLSIHVRRTDKLISKINKIELTSNECFINFINKNKNYNIFLATDCYETQIKFKEKFGNKLFWFEKIKKPWNYTLKDCETYGVEPCPDFRPTSLESTAIDLFTCVYSDKFMGTNVSGMSEFIDYNRKIKSKVFL